MWANQNLHSMKVRTAQQHFAVSVWAGIVDYCLLSATVFTTIMFGQHKLPPIYSDCVTKSYAQDSCCLFQMNMVPAHSGNDARCYLTR